MRAEIERACREASRDPKDVTLVAVSKTFFADAIEPVLAAGQRVFGENRVQEAQKKWPPLLAGHPGVELHMIGPLQSNKAKEAVALFDAIHTLDRPSLATRLARLADADGRQPALFVQVNTGAEPQKAGVLPADADAFVAACRADGLRLDGAMCIPPEGEDAAPHFRLLRSIAQANGLPGLSMGMSADFETAIAHGATHVRVGSAIFGARTNAAG